MSSSSGHRSCDTYLNDSLCGLSVCRACHHASMGILPGILQTLFCCLVGKIRFPSPSFMGTLPQPNRGDLLYFGLGEITSALSSILGRSKLSMLYPVTKSGSCSLTRAVSPSMISLSSPLNWCSERFPARSITAAAHSIRLVAILVSRSKEKVTKGAGKGSVLDSPSRLQETIMSTGYIPDPPSLTTFSSAKDGSVLELFFTASGALSPAQRTSPVALMWGPRSRSNIRRFWNGISALVISQLSSFLRRFLTE